MTFFFAQQVCFFWEPLHFFFRGCAMKRATTASIVAPKRPKHESGILYLYQQLQKLDTHASSFIVEAEDSDVTSWSVGISSGALRKDLGLPELAQQLDQWQSLSKQAPVIVLDIRFPVDYPKTVPFVRVVRPRFQWRTGHVTIGGSFCTELLTPSGWRPMCIQTLLLTICDMLREGKAKIQLRGDEHCAYPLKDYSEVEAKSAYERVALFHGWSTRKR